MSTPLVKEAMQVEVPQVDAPEDEVSRTSRGKHSTNEAEGREAKRISQSNTAPRKIQHPRSFHRKMPRVMGQVSTT